eukprot:CAMPEP_0173423078 /NCGR_PEP_ID=MMETSP1357-20121228/3530_1 /TAXON_ID=77926 /ORGANISM="Hemiselmis rufescens, Strain PCC563" /LENGTH=56 /DNA_ID=CAMNT_0014386157 /DNA_START=159 /DNA_END=326 /DNA_ORIENTATION=-
MTSHLSSLLSALFSYLRLDPASLACELPACEPPACELLGEPKAEPPSQADISRGCG